MIRIVIASSDRRERDELRRKAIDDPDVTLLGVARDGQEAVQLAVQYRPDVAVLSEGLRVIDAYDALALISSAAPGVKTLLVTREQDEATLQRAMKAGARRCLARPATADQILETAMHVAALDEIRRRPEFQPALDPALFPRMIAVTGGKGGVGKTSLVTNLGITLAQSNQGPTCLVDLYTQFGDVATMLDVRPRQTLVDLVQLGDEIDGDVVATAAVKHSSGLDVLLGASTPHPLDAVPVDRLEQVLSALRQRYRFILIDVPPILHAGTLHVLETAHRVLLVCNLMDLTTVTDTSRLLDAIVGTYVPRERVSLVLNRVSRQNQLAIEMVEQRLRFPISMKIPNDDQLVTKCANEGTPFVMAQPNHPVSQAVKRAALRLAEDPEDAEIASATERIPAPHAEEVRTEKRGLFGLLRRDPATAFMGARPAMAEERGAL